MDSKRIRVKAGGKLTAGVLGSLATGALVYFLEVTHLLPRNPFILIIPALPIVLAGIGFVELVSGRPFAELAGAWMELKGWQRGVLGTFIVLFALVLIITLFGLVLSSLPATWG